MFKDILKNLVIEKKREKIPDFVIVNFIKEALQFPVLAFIYSKEKYKNFIFTGGSCLRICYSLPRLSEDLDFDLFTEGFENLDLDKLGDELADYFKKDFLLNMSYRRQGSIRLYLKFSILKDLGMVYGNSSNFLYVKIEPSIGQFKNFDTEFTPVASFGFNFLAKNYTLKFLMTGKIMAVLSRQWFKGENNAINIKGRDYYDLYWYLSKNIKPDFTVLTEKLSIKNETELKEALRKKIEKDVDETKLAYDLKGFFSDQVFISGFCRNYKEIMRKYLG